MIEGAWGGVRVEHEVIHLESRTPATGETAIEASQCSSPCESLSLFRSLFMTGQKEKVFPQNKSLCRGKQLIELFHEFCSYLMAWMSVNSLWTSWNHVPLEQDGRMN